jgi:PRC-barrel domain
MKTKFYLGLGAAAALAVVLALANQNVRDAHAQVTTDREQPNQVQSNQTRQIERTGASADRSRHTNSHKASDLIGMNVRGRDGDDDIGSINDLKIGQDGKVIYAAVSFGGFLGLGDKLFAVPFDAIEFVKTDDEFYARIDVNEESMENMEGFNQDNWPEQPNRKFAARHGQRPTDRPADVDVDVSR